MKTLYYHTICAKSRLVRLLLEETKLQYEIKNENYWELRENFTKISPAHELPVLVEKDGGKLIIIPGIYPIVEYIIDTHGKKGLLTSDTVIDAEARRISSWFFNKFHQEVLLPITEQRFLCFYLKNNSPDSKAIRQAKNSLKEHLEYLTYLLSNRDWLACNKMTIADLVAAAFLSILDYIGEINWQEYKAIKAWYMIIKSRPSFRVLLNEKIAGFNPSNHYNVLDF